MSLNPINNHQALNNLNSVTRFDASAWASAIDINALGLSFNSVITLNDREIVQIEQDLLGRAGKAGITHLTIPKGLSLNKLVQLAPELFKEIDSDVLKKYGDVEVKQAYDILITNHFHKESRNLNDEEQSKLLKDAGYDLPKIIEVVSLILLNSKVLQKEIYKDPTFPPHTRCAEKVNGFATSVGNNGGLVIGENPWTYFNCGAAAVKSLSGRVRSG